MNPLQTALVVGFEMFTLNYDLLVELRLEPGAGARLRRIVEPVRGRPDVDVQDARRDALVGRRAGDGGGCPLDAPVRPRWDRQRGRLHRLGYLDSYVGDAGVTAVEAPDPTDAGRDHGPARTTRSCGPTCRSCPKHIWKDDHPGQASPTSRTTPPVVGSGPYQAVEWETGQFVRLREEPQLLEGTQRRATRSSSRSSRARTRWSRRSAPASSTTPAGRTPTSSTRSATEEGIVAVEGGANGFTEFGFNTLRHRHGQHDPGRRPVDAALLRPGVPRRHRLRHRQGPPGRPGARRLWRRSARPRSPPGPDARGTSRPTTPRPFDIELAKSKLDAAGYAARCQRRAPGQGGQADQPGRLFMPDSEATYPAAAQFIQDWFGQLGIQVSTRSFDSQNARPTSCCRPRRRDDTADYDLFIWGWGGDAGPELAAQDLHLRRRSAARSDSQWCNPALRRAVRAAERGDDDGRAQGLHRPRCRTCSTTRRRTTCSSTTPSSHAYRTDMFEGWENQPLEDGAPLFGYGSTELHAPDTRRREQPSAAPSAGSGTQRVPARHDRRRRRPWIAGTTSGDQHADPDRRGAGGRGRRGRPARLAPASRGSRARRSRQAGSSPDDERPGGRRPAALAA